MTLTELVDRLLRETIEKPQLTDEDRDNMLRWLAKWRHAQLTGTMIAKHGNVVQAGPFAGLRFTGQTSEGCTAPRLLGCYEHELHSHLERLIGERYDAILNIGCADGYYAAGLAKRMPGVPVFAHDVEPQAQAGCREVAALNGVSDRVQVGGPFRGSDFAAYAGRKTWLVMDIEGAERDLLDPVAYPALRDMTVLVECHDCFFPRTADEIAGRFRSHDVIRVDHAWPSTPLPIWLQKRSHLEQLLAIWEFRMGPTPWLIMEPR
ncbi:MAG: hypothetical protein ABJA98_15270 [Acidobacteriota bacterium]